jgi:aspartate carbamoyltransferase regulatory subunit
MSGIEERNPASTSERESGGSEAKNRQTMKVQKLRQGTVIDHLTSGTAIQAFRVLDLGHEGGVVLIGMNLRSEKAGRKDIIKIEHRELTRDELNRIALLSPEASISIIRDFRVVKKFRVEIPESIVGILRCRNPNCITKVEKIRSKFKVWQRDPPVLRCWYCERRVKQGEFDFII